MTMSVAPVFHRMVFFLLFSRVGCLSNNVYQGHLIAGGGLVGLGCLVDLVWFGFFFVGVVMVVWSFFQREKSLYFGP